MNIPPISAGVGGWRFRWQMAFRTYDAAILPLAGEFARLNFPKASRAA